MPNSYFNNTRTMLAGTTARGATIEDDFDRVEAGFDLIESDISGIEDVNAAVIAAEAAQADAEAAQAAAETAQAAAEAAAGGFTWKYKTAAYTAASAENIHCDTSTAAWSLKLPASPSANDFVRIAVDDISTNALTIDKNGSTIEGVDANLTVDISHIEWVMIFDGTTWKIYG